jgi:hypothetical protein
MTPETVSAINAVCSLLDKIGTLPVGAIILIILVGPWVFSIVIGWRQQRQFDAMRLMYENNVTLTKSYVRLADGQQEMISLNSAKWTEAIQKIDTNQFCPVHRTKKVRMEDVPQ